MRKSIELNEFDLRYMPQIMIKAQALANFVIKHIEDEQEMEQESLHEWIVYVNGSSNSEGNGAGIILIGLEGQKVKYTLRL